MSGWSERTSDDRHEKDMRAPDRRGYRKRSYVKMAGGVQLNGKVKVPANDHKIIFFTL